MMCARRVRVVGRVQGVFYRAWTKEQADGLGVTGWVRNAPDGSVEAHLAGEEQAVAELTERMRHGPPHARVDDVHVEPAPPESSLCFSVRD